MKTGILLLSALSGVLTITGCKSDFLDIKQNISQAVPHTIADFQGILDNSITMNSASSHSLGILGGDEFYIEDGKLSTITDAYQRNGYIWSKEIFEGGNSPDWNNAYARILLANLSIEGISKITPAPNETKAWNNVKGSGLFFRALNFYQLAQLFCKTYDASTAQSDLGIPLRLESDINLKSSRGSVYQTYNRILIDLQEAAELLPDIPLVKNRPSRPAAYALLAKAYLLMGEYENARSNANKCLEIQNGLIDLKTLASLSVNYPIAAIPIEENKELIFLSATTNITLIAPARFNADVDLLNSYLEGDLRRDAWFFTNNGKILYGGGYNSGKTTGLGVNEVLLIRAECLARADDITGALADLNYLLKNRYNNSFNPILSMNRDDLLAMIIRERRKELVMRGIRWEDLKRLNKDPRFAKKLVREIDGKQYELLPNDPRYVWPIPDQEIVMSGLSQNIR